MEKACKCYYCDYVDVILSLPSSKNFVIDCHAHGSLTISTFYYEGQDDPWTIGFYRINRTDGIRMYMCLEIKKGFLYLDSGEALEVKFDPDNAIEQYKKYLLFS
jgi:hypothetical protein